MTHRSPGAAHRGDHPGQPLFAAVDVGTTGARAVAFDLAGRRVAELRHAYPTRFPQPGWAEQDADDWANGAVVALRGLAARASRRGTIRAVGLTGQCPTMVPVDRRARPVGPGMLYKDNRAVAEAQELRHRFGAAHLHRRTGHVPEAFHVGPKVLWLRRRQPRVFGRTRLVLQPRDVVLHRVAGRVATDQTHANATVFYDLRRRGWETELLEALDLDPALFPAVLAPWEVAAELPASSATELGLPAGIPIVVGAADSQCALFGAGIVAAGPVSEMAGASSCLNSVVAVPLTDLRVTHYSHLVPGCFATELGINTTGAAVAWAVRALGYAGFSALEGDAGRFRRRVLRAAAGTSAVPAVDVAPIFLPYLGDGERDDPEARAGFLGLSDRHDRAALAFAVIEGVALGVRTVLRILEHAGAPVEELRVGGGGARSEVAGQLKADLLCRPVRHLDLDPASFGVAMLAAASAGMAEEAEEAIRAVLGRARQYLPSRAGAGFEADRAAWFDAARPSPAVHRG